MTIYYLSKQGYGTINELREMDSKIILDLIEYEQISNAIQRYKIEQAKNGNGH